MDFLNQTLLRPPAEIIRGRPCGNKKLTGRKRFVVVDVLGLVLALRLTSANVGERAGALLLFTALGQRFTRLKTIPADQGFDGVNFLAHVKATYQLTVNVVCGVLGVKGFQVVPHRRPGSTIHRLAGPPFRFVGW